MGHSDFITIYTKLKKIDFVRVSNICKELYKPEFMNDYLENKNIFDYFLSSLEKQNTIDFQNYMEYRSCFINYDGENDEEVHKCSRLFCKVCNYLYNCLIKLTSDKQEHSLVFIWDEDNKYFCKYKDMTENKYIQKDYFKRIELENKLLKLKPLNKKSLQKFIEE